MAPRFIPARGDVVWITLDPQLGHETKGRRPALVISPKAYNAKVGLAILCPITSRVKGYPFEVPMPDDVPIAGVVLADQVKNVDWRARRAALACQLRASVVAEVLAKLGALIDPRVSAA